MIGCIQNKALWSSGWILDRMSCNTSAAKTGEAGHPWEKPSVTGMTVQSPFSSRTKVLCFKGGEFFRNYFSQAFS
jgi:hypothetical protein